MKYDFVDEATDESFKERVLLHLGTTCRRLIEASNQLNQERDELLSKIAKLQELLEQSKETEKQNNCP